ncbi:MAG: aminoacyl-histidine dipeptidase [Tyzzerella sp.]|nr:aminoacyl-histidine dipeptidase [Tyzzerella sp.]
MKVLQGLEPASVFGFFEDICNIPHISYHEKELSDYCVNFAKERGLDYKQDSMGNVIIIGEATPGYEDVEPIIIQGHLDMVGDKVPECPIDMEKEPIKVMIDGDYLTADGTTLGGDDGIAVAYGLALLDAKDIPHPRLEVVLTVSEEVGLEGATGIDLSCCKAKRLLNIDSEDEGVFTAGCAGGVRADCSIPGEAETKSGVVCEIKTQGFLGGHSGIEIDKGRANANTTMGRFFLLLKEKTAFDLVSIVGGVKDNVIPKNASATFLVAENDIEAVKAAVAEFNGYLDVEYGVSDPDIELVLEVKETAECKVLSEISKEKAITALNLMPNGVQAMSMDLPGLVETSLNMGVIQIDEEGINLCFSIRSSYVSAKDFIGAKLKQITEMLGGSVSFQGQYPGWPYARDSKLRDLCVKVYKEQYGKEPKIDVIHAGLECGILSSKVEGLDCISIGPDMSDVHTPDEKISISSVARVWEFLKAVLAEK